MKLRIITAVIGITLLVIVLVLPPIALMIALSAICGLAMAEMLGTSNKEVDKTLLAASVLYSAATPFFVLWDNLLPASIITLTYLLLTICIQICRHSSLAIEQTGFSFFMSLIFPISFSCLAYIRVFSERDGLFLVLLAIVIPWMCDMGAYFVGTFFGKHKLCPNISPKKTVEGLVGGMVVSLISALAVSLVYRNFFLKDEGSVQIWPVVIFTLICAPLSVLGDLFASLIKRQRNVKDFGHIMPGHGGIMDRFDSFLLAVPFFYIILHFVDIII